LEQAETARFDGEEDGQDEEDDEELDYDVDEMDDLTIQNLRMLHAGDDGNDDEDNEDDEEAVEEMEEYNDEDEENAPEVPLQNALLDSLTIEPTDSKGGVRHRPTTRELLPCCPTTGALHQAADVGDGADADPAGGHAL
jgi:hypothetical protein